jgi:ABC-type polysaccharide/polyol phosphate transport system ATPase subunit
VYGLLLNRQASRLYIDGQLALESHGLPADYSHRIEFGVYQPATLADSESAWQVVRVMRLDSEAAGLKQVPGLPPAWPDEVWATLVRDALARGDTPTALNWALRGRIAHPDRPVTVEALEEAFRTAYAADEQTAAVARRKMQQLALVDRAAMAAALRTHAEETLLRCTDLGVRFRSGLHNQHPLRRMITSIVGRSEQKTDSEFFWAVRNVSFELRSGELVGIIGRNGAGKSTLLNVLADLIVPDEGKVVVNGKVILLTPGTGFLPALTGRENLFLAGLYLGLTRKEIRERIDEIIEFAELWDAIDRPFRGYSAGMMARLQFALATAIEPEILLLDELLGAGDAAFTDKAQARMHSVLRRARAVVLVTHDLDFVRKNCSQAVLLEGGQVYYQGAPESVISAYQDLLARRPHRAMRPVSAEGVQ